ncbi:Glycine zipper 2TM domain-containing protein [Noviherbaspirillum humi]|uniref:Glycine zipper 2TM domain-containing protein n=1 Tax=Noviherbaspirillum humi TaxID=1688639 RepID=A0A239DSA3_9BURK|nr:glycine zipper 2TM domain-containing protein [Noviherbaspirillum humi]SNS35495.1 Glycine zipper 2TM domain-containing protein [Noviherbaspirillum humi]
MIDLKIKTGLAGMCLLALTACGSTGGNMMGGSPMGSSSMGSGSMPMSTSSASGTGVVQSVEVVPRDNPGIGLGTVAGAVVGGLLGNQVGSGNGRTAATVAGAAGGAYAGNQMQRNSRAAGGETYRVTVRMDNGAVQTLAQDNAGMLQVGERVRVANGQVVERFR